MFWWFVQVYLFGSTAPCDVSHGIGPGTPECNPMQGLWFVLWVPK